LRFEIREEPLTVVDEYATISIAFEVCSVFQVCGQGNRGQENRDQGNDGQENRGDEFVLVEQRLDVPYQKDYDAIGGEKPTEWPRRFDMSNWVLFGAREQGRLVGGVALVFSTSGESMFEGRADLAILWDIRVSPDSRGQGIGALLFAAAEAKARSKNCKQLKIETQNINVGACRFYERQGCALRAVNRRAYVDFPDEMQLWWYKDLV
jgi:GNAT superfamily N-acetyltransferase